MRRLALILFLLCWTDESYAQQSVTSKKQIGLHQDDRWLGDSHFEGRTYVFAAPDELLRQSSTWNAESDKLPLSPKKAEAAAISQARRIRPDVKEWHCHSLALRRLETNVWVFAVMLFRADVASVAPPDSLEIPVLMNGKAVEPVRQRRPPEK